jgi:site-specific DNA-methyltransferase (adenine-specific)
LEPREQRAYEELSLRADKLGSVMRAFMEFLGPNDMMAYLAMMAIRLIELHRVLKPTGSLYLHCDPTASHYLKLLLDGVFGAIQFRAEIVWRRYGAHNDSRTYGRVHDIIFFYSKTGRFTFNKQHEVYSEEYIKERFRFADPDGRRWAEQNLSSPNPRPNLTYPFTAKNGVTYQPPANGWKYTRERMEEIDQANGLHYPAKQEGRLRLKNYLDERAGVPVQDVWIDLTSIGGTSPERLGYPTQKPLGLLERIISASSNEGDVVLDPFCGCGTAVHAAQKLGRQWIGIDITHLAISLIEKRLKDAFPGIRFEVHGTPKDLASARDLAQRDKYQFQWWAVSMVEALPFGGKKKGADGGIDGIIYFKPDGKRTEKALVSVKGGANVSVNMIRDLHSAMEREKAPIGVFITAAMPTRVMETEAAAVGRFESEATGKTYPRLQIITLAELFQGKKPDIPFVDQASVKRAKREATGRQERLI